MKLIFLHPGDLDAFGWFIVAIWVLLFLALVFGAVYLLYYLAKKNGERLIRKRKTKESQ